MPSQNKFSQSQPERSTELLETSTNVKRQLSTTPEGETPNNEPIFLKPLKDPPKNYVQTNEKNLKQKNYVVLKKRKSTRTPTNWLQKTEMHHRQYCNLGDRN